MANIKVSEMPETTAANIDDLIMIIQGGGNKKITEKNLLGDRVVVSPTEPTGDNRKKVWMQKGKNKFNPNDKTKYIRVCFNDGTATDIQLEQGTTATTYEPYVEDKIYIKNNNDVYEEFIKKQEEVYSTTETKIGTWIDGKTLYRKVYDGIALSGNETIVEQTSGIIVQKIYGYFVHTTNKSIQEIGAYRAMDTASTSRVLWDGTYVKVQGGTDWQTGQYTVRVIIEYTKTTE